MGVVNMKIDRSCKTCEYCIIDDNGVYNCTSISSNKKVLSDFEKEKPCWTISIDHWCSLVSKLPYNLREIYVNEVGGRAEQALFQEFNANNSTDLLIKMVERVNA